MATPYGTVHRPSTASTSAPMAQTDEQEGSTQKTRNDTKFICPFSIPTSPEAAAVRIIRNLITFGLYYAYFVWVILFISLIPKRKVSLIFLVVMRDVICLYLLLLSALPNSVVLHKIFDKLLVMALLVIATTVELILTRAALHLLVTLAVAIPNILVHAVFWRRDDSFVVDEEASAAGEMVPLGYNKSGDAVSLDLM